MNSYDSRAVGTLELACWDTQVQFGTTVPSWNLCGAGCLKSEVGWIRHVGSEVNAKHSISRKC